MTAMELSYEVLLTPLRPKEIEYGAKFGAAGTLVHKDGEEQRWSGVNFLNEECREGGTVEIGSQTRNRGEQLVHITLTQ